MAMNRAGLKSLMGYENGGGVTNEEQTNDTNQNITISIVINIYINNIILININNRIKIYVIFEIL